MKILACLLIGYAFGCFLTAEVVARHYCRKSAYSIGSGNPGMANIMAELGKKPGFLVLAGDILKTLLAFLTVWLLFGKTMGRDAILLAGAGVFMGHNYPVWKGFKGGKGVTVTCTWIIIYMPLWGILSCVIGGAATLLSGYLSVGGVLIPLLAVPFAFLTGGIRAGLIMLAAFILMVQKHGDGLLRIWHGTEKKRFRKKK